MTTPSDLPARKRPEEGAAGLDAGYRAIETLYPAFLTGLILTTVSRRSGAAAAELVFRAFRRQHLEKFLPGLAKLGLARLPHAVACPQYHYLSNDQGDSFTEWRLRER